MKPSIGEMRKIVQSEAQKAAEGFLSSGGEIKVTSANLSKSPDEVVGPGIEVVGDEFNYSCVLEYEASQNEDILKLIFDKFPFVKEGEIPEIDILDALGEFLNILCGKINYHLQEKNPELNIEVPYFVYGLEPIDSGKEAISVFDLKGEAFSFSLYFFWS